MSNKTVTLDVREDLRSGREPFTKIMRAAAELRRGGRLLIVAPFQPVPLFTVLKKLGFSYTAKPTDAGDWEVLFTRQSEAVAQEPAQPVHREISRALPKFLSRLRRSAKAASSLPPSSPQVGSEQQHAVAARLTSKPQSDPNSGLTPAKALEVDARGLEPPQPLVKILETLAELPEGAELKARTDRRPIHLYAQLEERGFVGETTEQPDGSFLTYVRRV